MHKVLKKQVKFLNKKQLLLLAPKKYTLDGVVFFYPCSKKTGYHNISVNNMSLINIAYNPLISPGYVVAEIDLFQGYRELEYNDHVTF